MSNQILSPSIHAFAPPTLALVQDTSAHARNSGNAPSSAAPLINAEIQPAPKGPSHLQLNWRKGQKPTDIKKLTQSPDSKLNLHRMKGHPPIVEMTPGDMLAALQGLREDVMKNWETVNDPIGFSKLFSARGLKDAMRTYGMKKKWNQRLDQTIKILNDFTRADMHQCTCLAYMVDNTLAGGLLLRPDTPPYVADVLTHPGSEKACGVLIEEAVNLSHMWKSKGELALIADNKQAREAYEHMGFVRTVVNRYGPRNYMTLDPSTSDKWHQDLDEKWRMKKFGDDELDQYNEKEYLG